MPFIGTRTCRGEMVESIRKDFQVEKINFDVLVTTYEVSLIMLRFCRRLLLLCCYMVSLPVSTFKAGDTK